MYVNPLMKTGNKVVIEHMYTNIIIKGREGGCDRRMKEEEIKEWGKIIEEGEGIRMKRLEGGGISIVRGSPAQIPPLSQL